MCGCPARGCLEAIPSGGEYQDLLAAFKKKKKRKGGGGPVFGQMIISECRTHTFSRLHGKTVLRPSPKNLNLKF